MAAFFEKRYGTKPVVESNMGHAILWHKARAIVWHKVRAIVPQGMAQGARAIPRAIPQDNVYLRAIDKKFIAKCLFLGSPPPGASIHL